MKWLNSLSIGLFSLVFCIGIHNPTANAQPAADSSARSADQQVFDAQFSKWKEVLVEMNNLRVKFQDADKGTKEKLQVELKKQYEKARTMIPGMVKSGIVVYKADPKGNQDLKKFLGGVGLEYATNCRYKEAIPILKAVQEGGGKDLDLMYACSVIANFSLGNYEATKENFIPLFKSELIKEDASKISNPRIKQLVSGIQGLAAVLPTHKAVWDKEQAIRKKEAEADDLPRVLLKTTKGDIVLELFENEAPNAVKSFVNLVDSGFYNGLTFHRVIPFFMAQGGDPTGSGNGGPGYAIPCECYKENARKHFAGTLSMAHAGRDTGGSQFFLTTIPTTFLDGRHTAFGRIVKGLETVGKLQIRIPAPGDPSQQSLPAPDKIIEAKVLRKRPGTNYKDFTKLPKR